MPAVTRAQQIAAAFPVLPRELEVGELVVRVDAIAADATRVAVTGQVSRGGAPVEISWPVVVVNPPAHAWVGDALTDDPVLALAQILADLAGS